MTLFYLFGAVAVVASLLVIAQRNPIYSVLLLIASFGALSGLYVLLDAPFVAVIQIIVYAGAIMVLFLFVIMLLNLTPEELREQVSLRRKGFAATLCVSLFALLSIGIARSPTVRNAGDLTALTFPSPELANAGETVAIGRALFTTHALAFEYSSILILVAILGANYLTKKRRKTGALTARATLTGLEPQGNGGERQAATAGARLERRPV